MVAPASHRHRRAFDAALRSGWHVAEVGEAVLAVARALAGVARVDREVLRWPQLIALPALSGLLHEEQDVLGSKTPNIGQLLIHAGTEDSTY